jgi:tetratricopeptide (TPR) repeat protein
MSECLSTHAISTAIMEREPWDFMATYYTAIDHFSHRFMDYHPPRREHISEADFELYSHVMEGIYRFHDMMLERLLQLAGPDTTVVLCSDHGFQSAGGRLAGTPREPAGPAAWHRPYGMLVMAGPGIKRGSRVHGATLLDIAPTILHLFGLPVGRDMDGRVLVDAMQSPQEPNSIASWDQVAGDFADPQPLSDRERPQGSALIEQFAALGYVDDPALDDQKQATLASIEANYNLARCHASIGQYREAESLLRNLLLERPWDDRFILHLADCYLKSGKLRQSERLLDQAYELSTTNMAALLIWAQLKLALRQERQAGEILNRAVQLNPRSPVVMVRLAELHLVARENELAIEQLENALQIDPEMVEAHVAISAALLRTGSFQAAVDSALCAIELVYQIPRAHINLGVGLARGGDRPKAIEAFENVQRFAPGIPAVLRWLSHLHGDSSEGRSYHDQLAKAIEHKRSKPLVVDSNPEFLQHEIEIPGEQERLVRAMQERPDSRHKQADSGRMLVIVSGLPRSGTSLMMQILEEGGLSAKTDQVRRADADNPKGYLEWEAIKSLPKNPTLLDDPEFTKLAVKITSPLISQLPRHHRYKIVFMDRDIAEIAASQSKMIQRQAVVSPTLSVDDLRLALTRHLDHVGCWLADAPNIEVLRISFRKLIDSPAREIAKVIEFLGLERLPNVQNMSTIVDQSLYRNRS